MPFFICLCLLISYLVQSHHPFELIIESVWSKYLGLACMILAITIMALKKWSLGIRFDLFCSGSMLVWISTWPPHFNENSPVLFFFPIFMCFMAVLAEKLFIQQALSIDKLTLGYLRQFTNSLWLHTGFILAAVLLGLVWIDNYQFFPTMMSILIAKYALLKILEITDFNS